MRWFRKAAFRGDAISRRMLGLAYLRGEGVDQSDSLARTWLRQAAEQGDAPAKEQLDAMVDAGLPATATPPAPRRRAAVDQPGGARTPLVRYRIAGDGVRLRSLPSLNGVVMDRLGDGEVVEGRGAVEEGWMPVYHPRTGRTGYVAEYLLTPRSAEE